jgi:hypothetical protein
MNHLSPLIVRQGRHPARPFAEWHQPAAEPKAKLTDDLRLFLTGWLGGLVFFGTFLS